MDDDYETLDGRRYKTLSTLLQRVVVRECQIVVLAGRVGDSEVGNFRAGHVGKGVVDGVSHVLLSVCHLQEAGQGSRGHLQP